jgi:hypothetical protein
MIATDDARQALEDAAEALRNGHDRDADREIARAQALALIAIAEEQRTANLIALFDEEGPEVFTEPRTRDSEENHRAVGREKARWRALVAEVADRLDLEDRRDRS